ncbi:hypothetical protein BH20BAC1_BH20BAC1_08260 [soil metagenome]
MMISIEMVLGFLNTISPNDESVSICWLGCKTVTDF